MPPEMPAIMTVLLIAEAAAYFQALAAPTCLTAPKNESAAGSASTLRNVRPVLRMTLPGYSSRIVPGALPRKRAPKLNDFDRSPADSAFLSSSIGCTNLPAETRYSAPRLAQEIKGPPTAVSAVVRMM